MRPYTKWYICLLTLKSNMLYFRRVKGYSMTPRYYPGAVLVARTMQPKVGDVVIARVNEREVVKRVEKLDREKVFLVGDNRLESTDSREYGPVPVQAVLGVVIADLPGPVPARPFGRLQKILATLYAAILAMMAVTQLVTFEDFTAILQQAFGLQSPDVVLPLAATITALEVLALPYLLSMAISPLFRVTTRAIGYCIAILWLGIGLLAGAEPIGFFGGLLDIPNGAATVACSSVLFMLACGVWLTGRMKKA